MKMIHQRLRVLTQMVVQVQVALAPQRANGVRKTLKLIVRTKMGITRDGSRRSTPRSAATMTLSGRSLMLAKMLPRILLTT